MGTRTGDVDPAVVFHLGRAAGTSVDEIDDLLNKRSGMLGLTGYSDMRDVHAASEAGDHAARLGLTGQRLRLGEAQRDVVHGRVGCKEPAGALFCRDLQQRVAPELQQRDQLRGRARVVDGVGDATALAGAFEIDRKLYIDAHTLGDTALACADADDAATRQAANFDAVHERMAPTLPQIHRKDPCRSGAAALHRVRFPS